MTEVAAGMLSTGQFFTANNHTKMFTLRISCLARPWFNRTADLSTSVFTTSLHLIADSLTSEISDLINLLLGHELS